MKEAPLLLFQLCHALGLTDSPSKNVEALQRAARWALADELFDLGTYEAIALQPVLATLKGEITDAYIPALPLNLKPENLLLDASPTADELKAQLDTLKASLKQANLETQLLTALEIHASTLAVSEKYNDLSLYDFCKMTAGIACCLERSSKIRLVGGSISGIQTYLYDIVSKNAAKLLKGRSFYLQLLTDSLLEELLKEFKLPSYNVVYASGGGFFVLMPDTANIEEQFKIFSTRIAGQIYDRHKTALFAELAHTDAFDTTKEVNVVWKELYDKLDVLKYRRLHQNEQLIDDFFADAVEVGGIQARDPITNDEITDTDETETLVDDTVVLKYTKQQIDLGRKLAKAAYWQIANKPLRKSKFEDPFGKFHFLLKAEDRLKAKRQPIIFNPESLETLERFTFYGGNKFPTFNEDIYELIEGEEKKVHRKGDVKTFDRLVDSDGLKRLAILRMDVDDLGAIFSDEITKIYNNRYTVNFTRYATTSRSLDYFFKGYLNTLQQKAAYKDWTIIIYSGGDDLFIAGKWNAVLELAQDIHKAFEQWSCNNLTLSGGIVLLPKKFPVMQGARLAEIAEKKAKKHQLSEEIKKNSICLFDTPLHWEHEFEKIVQDLYYKMIALFEAKDLNKSFLDKINSHANAELAHEKAQKEFENVKNIFETAKKIFEESPDIEEYRNNFEKAKEEFEKKRGNPLLAPKWRWIMAYDISRYIKDNKLQGEAAQFVQNVASNTFLNFHNNQRIQSNYSYLTLLQIAVRWVELELRSKSKIE